MPPFPTKPPQLPKTINLPVVVLLGERTMLTTVGAIMLPWDMTECIDVIQKVIYMQLKVFMRSVEFFTSDSVCVACDSCLSEPN